MKKNTEQRESMTERKPIVDIMTKKGLSKEVKFEQGPY